MICCSKMELKANISFVKNKQTVLVYMQRMFLSAVPQQSGGFSLARSPVWTLIHPLSTNFNYLCIKWFDHIVEFGLA